MAPQLQFRSNAAWLWVVVVSFSSSRLFVISNQIVIDFTGTDQDPIQAQPRTAPTRRSHRTINSDSVVGQYQFVIVSPEWWVEVQ